MKKAFTTLRVHLKAKVAYVILDNPPLNLYDGAVLTDLDKFADQLRRTKACASLCTQALTQTSSSLMVT